MIALWVRCLALCALLACLSAGALPSVVRGAGFTSTRALTVAAHQTTVVAAADPQRAAGEDAISLSDLTGVLAGLGLVLTLIALIGLRACDRQTVGRPLRRHRRL